MAVSASPLHLSQMEGLGEVPCGTSGKEPTRLPSLSPPHPNAKDQSPVTGRPSDPELDCCPLGVNARAVARGNLGQGSPGLSMGNSSEPKEAQPEPRQEVELKRGWNFPTPAAQAAHPGLAGGDVCSTSLAEWRSAPPDVVRASRQLSLQVWSPVSLS